MVVKLFGHSVKHADLSRLSKEERSVIDIMADPVSFGETFLKNRDGSPLKYREYQKEDLRDESDQIAHLDGRTVGKSIDVSGFVLWAAFTTPGIQILVVAPFHTHLHSLLAEIEYQIEVCPEINEAIKRRPRGDMAIERAPHYMIPFTNGSVLHFRPAGDQGTAFRSLHVDIIVADEAAYIPERAWKALMPCLLEGGLFRVYSTPNGIRENTYYRITTGKGWKVYHWPSWIAPDWTAQREQRLIEYYGGKDSPGWQHEVAGEHGRPSFGAFSTDDVVKATVTCSGYKQVTVTGAHLDGANNESEIRERVLALMDVPGGHGKYWIGGDLGYTSDPTEIVLFSEDDKGELWPELRVHAEHVPYTAITEVLAFLDRAYNPLGMGLDRGNNGISVIQELTGLDKYRDLHLAPRLTGFDFGGQMTVGEDDDGKPIRRRTKVEMTTVLQRLLSERHLWLPAQDPKFHDQLCSQTYTQTENGIVYSKGNDHIIDALRCMVMKRSLDRQETYQGNTLCVRFCASETSRPLP